MFAVFSCPFYWKKKRSFSFDICDTEISLSSFFIWWWHSGWWIIWYRLSVLWDTKLVWGRMQRSNSVKEQKIKLRFFYKPSELSDFFCSDRTLVMPTVKYFCPVFLTVSFPCVSFPVQWAYGLLPVVPWQCNT